MARELVVRIIGDPSSLNKAFATSGASAKTFGQKMESVGASMRSVGKHMTIAGAAITGVAVVIGKKLVDSALAAEVSQAKLEKSFQNAGLSASKYTKQITAAEDASRKLGFTDTETRDSLQKLVQGGDSVKKAMTDMALAQDFARATGRDLATATGSIVKVHQGLLRPLKELGISLPQVTDHMKALTEEHKKSKTAITANEKALAFQQDKMETGAKAIELMTEKLHGQADAFSKTSAGGLAVFNAQLEHLQEALGTLLLPFLDKAIGFLNRLNDALSNLSPQTQKLIVDIGLAVAAFGAVMLVLGPVIAGIGALLPIIVALASPIGIVVAALVLLTAALVAAVLWPDKLQMALQKMGLSAKDSKEIVDDLRNAFTAIKAVVEAVMPAILAVVRPALEVIKGLLMIVSGILRGDFSEAWKGIKIVVANELKFVLAILTAFPRVVLGVAKQIGDAVLHGIGQGLQALPGVMKAGLAAIPGALARAAAYAGSAALAIGEAITEGIIAGMGSLASRVGSFVADHVRAAIDHVKATLGIGSPSKVMAGEVGLPMMEGLTLGIQNGAPAVATALYDAAKKALDAAKQAVSDSKGIFASAFDDLASNALAAFDKVSADFQTKTEKKIAAQDAQRAAADRKKALAEANAALAQAKAAQAGFTPQPGESPEDAAARLKQINADIAAAQQQQADALFAIQRAKDEKIAAQERKARDDSRELQRRHFEEQLTTLEAQLEKGRITAVQFRTRLLDLFEKFGVPFRAAGQALGSALAEGLHDSFADAGKAARALIEAIANEIAKAKFVANVQVNVTGGNPGHRAFGGPVSKGSPYIVGEKGPELFVPGTSGKIVPSMGGGGGTMAEITVPVYLDSAKITEVVRREMLRFQKRNGTSAV